MGTLTQNFIAKLDYLSRMYGPHMKLNIGITTILIISDADDSKSYLSHSSSLEKPQLFYADIKDVMGNGLLAANGKYPQQIKSKCVAPFVYSKSYRVFVKLPRSADTTKTAICLAFILLGLHPMVQENLHEEVMKILGPTAPCDAKNVKKLQYAEMVVLETLRIFPVVPLYARQNPYDVKLKSYTVPANTLVLINNFTMYRHEKYWSDPLSFHPERFSPENTTNRKKNGYAPFAIGQRMCPGSKYAVTEAVIILANVIRDYKISADYKSVEDVPLAFNVGIYLPEEANIAFNKRM
ncbi:cytochrome p450 [Rhyzopertha dominica]|nr:cytochrome p450 [Rhyzopertha dominica]